MLLSASSGRRDLAPLTGRHESADLGRSVEIGAQRSRSGSREDVALPAFEIVEEAAGTFERPLQFGEESEQPSIVCGRDELMHDRTRRLGSAHAVSDDQDGAHVVGQPPSRGSADGLAAELAETAEHADQQRGDLSGSECSTRLCPTHEERGDLFAAPRQEHFRGALAQRQIARCGDVLGAGPPPARGHCRGADRHGDGDPLAIGDEQPGIGALAGGQFTDRAVRPAPGAVTCGHAPITRDRVATRCRYRCFVNNSRPSAACAEGVGIGSLTYSVSLMHGKACSRS